MNKETFGKFLSETRRELGMTQQALADRLHVTDKAVSKWERGLSYPDVTLLEDLAAALGLTVAELMACRKQWQEDWQFVEPEQVSSLLDIANESNRNLRNKIKHGLIFLLISLLLASFITILYITRSETVAEHVIIWGKQTTSEGNLVYIEKDDRLITLTCENQQMFDSIFANNFFVHYAEYSWRPLSRKGTLKSCVMEPEEWAPGPLKGPMAMTGSATDVGSLFGIDCMWMKFMHIYPDPVRENQYLYSLSFFYRNDGKNYYSHKQDTMETEVLRVMNCRRFVSGDFDRDGIGELFILTRHNEAPFLIYDIEDGQIVSRFVEEAPALVQEQLDLDALLS